MPREQLRDPLGILDTYQFAINHTDESSNEQTRTVTRTANTAGTGFVRQQSASSPPVRKWTGTILEQAQYDAMQNYYRACSTRTVFFTDFTGVEEEVVITSFNPTRKRTQRNFRDPSIPLHYWTYEIVMEVVT